MADNPHRSSGDGWSDTSWSDPSYRRPGGAPGVNGSNAGVSDRSGNGGQAHGRGHANGRSNGRSAGASDWGSPSYSTRSGDDNARGSDRPARSEAARGSAAGTVTRDRAADRRGDRGTERIPARGDARQSRPVERPTTRQPAVGRDDRDPNGWDKAGPTSSRDQRATRAADRRAELEAERTRRSVERLTGRPGAYSEPEPDERGLPWWGALVVLAAITLLGAVVDSLGSISGQDGFNYGIVIASIVAILWVKRSHMFPVVVAPPIVYALAALLQLYVKSRSGSGSHSTLLIDAVQNYLVYGFPALAAGTAAALIIAGVRLVARK